MKKILNRRGSGEVRFRDSMRWKMEITIVGLIVALVTMLTLLQVTSQRASLNKALSTHSSFLKEQMISKADKASINLSGHIHDMIAALKLHAVRSYVQESVKDIEDLQYIILMQGKTPRVAYGADFDEDLKNKILSGDISDFTSRQRKSMKHEFEVGGHAFIESVMPIQLRNKHWGVLRLGFSLDQLNRTLADSQAFIDQEIRDRVMQAFLMALLFLIVGTIVIYFLAYRWTNPIQRLIAFSNELAGGNFDAKAHISIRTGDEVGVLAASLEEMAASLRDSYAKLEEYSRDLELKVEHRTSELAAAMDKAVNADKSKSEFLANMSHEIRTPMNAIVGLSYLAMDTEMNKQQQEYVKKIIGASNSLLAIINDILDFSKIEAGKLEMEIQDFDLEEALSNLSSVGGVQASKKGLNLLFDYPTEIPVLRGDAFRLGQVLLNLVNNAIKFTDKGEIIVAVEVLEQDESDIQLLFSVTDSGIGMDEDQQSRLFQSFTQADASTTRKYGGTGLGLAICKQLVALMGGEIGVDSKPGEGSRFYFTAHFSLSDRQSLLHRHSIPNVLNHLRVLIVDANAASGKILHNYATRFGFDAVLVASAAEALNQLESASEEQPFQLLLMDRGIPDMDCIDAVLCVRNSAELKQVPAIILLANDFDVIREQAEAAGVDGFLFKPVNASTLLDEIMSVLQINILSSVEDDSGSFLPDVSGIRGAHLLLVEDNEINQLVAQGLLAKYGVSISIANNGQEALNALEEECFDGVLMDLQMPVMGGLEATRIIREDARFSALPILALTANVMAGDREMCLQAGMNDHIAKPINPDDLYAKIAAWVKPANPADIADKAPPVAVQHGDSALAELDGIDINQGLQRVGEDFDLYRKILNSFFDNQTDTIEQMRQSLADSDSETAERLIHSLKSAARTIGAKALQAGAARLETAIKSGEPVDQGLIARVDDLLGEVIASIGRYREQHASAVASGAETDLDADLIMRQMDELLEDGNADALDLINNLSAVLAVSKSASSLSPLIQLLATKLTAYDFIAGRKVLHQIKQEYRDNIS